jgi:hypothetical protein
MPRLSSSARREALDPARRAPRRVDTRGRVWTAEGGRARSRAAPRRATLAGRTTLAMHGGGGNGGDNADRRSQAPWTARPLHAPGTFLYGLEVQPSLVREHPAGWRRSESGDDKRAIPAPRERRRDGLGGEKDERPGPFAWAASQHGVASSTGAASPGVSRDAHFPVGASQDAATVSGSTTSNGVAGTVSSVSRSPVGARRDAAMVSGSTTSNGAPGTVSSVSRSRSPPLLFFLLARARA